MHPTQRRLVFTRGQRGFFDGIISIVLASYLTHLGFTPAQIGTVVTGTLLGSAALSISAGLIAHRYELRRMLMAVSALMIATGLGLAAFTAFWAILLVAVLGTMNPSIGDVSPFLPLEQAAIASSTPPGENAARVFAWYNVAGAIAGSIGSLAAGFPEWIAARFDLDPAWGGRFVFLGYALMGAALALVYRRLPRFAHSSAARPLAQSRRTVFQLAALFSLDSFGGGFVVQSLLVLWLYRRFGLSVATAGTIFFFAGLAGALSQFAAAKLAARIGLIRTMVFTHLPANVFLILAGVMPTVEWAVAFLLLRASLSSMDVPARQAYVMSVVPPEERAAAASVTNVPRSLAAAIPPFLAGLMLEHTTFGWPLILGGTLKVIYDLLLSLWGRPSGLPPPFQAAR